MVELKINRAKSTKSSNITLSVFLIVVLSLGLVGGCGGSGSNSGQNNSTLIFTDVTLQSGFNYSHGYVNPIETEPRLISGGAAAGDFDNDGWVDLYVVRGSIGTNLLFKNMGNGSFQEVGQSAGVDIFGVVGSGPTFADFSGDGFLDLFIGAISSTNKPSLFLNNGNGTFSNISAGQALTSLSADNTFSAAFGDYDLDNDLDHLLHIGVRLILTALLSIYGETMEIIHSLMLALTLE